MSSAHVATLSRVVNWQPHLFIAAELSRHRLSIEALHEWQTLFIDPHVAHLVMAFIDCFDLQVDIVLNK